MKAAIIISVMLLFLMAGCKGNKQSTDGFITVDATASYPKKELILCLSVALLSSFRL